MTQLVIQKNVDNMISTGIMVRLVKVVQVSVVSKALVDFLISLVHFLAAVANKEETQMALKKVMI